MTRAPFTPLDWATWAAEMGAQGAVLVTALRLPRRDRPHAALFVFVLIAEVWMRATQELLFVGAPPQLPPSLRAVYHVETALVTAWPAAVAVLAWFTFSGLKSRWAMALIVAGWLGFNGAMVATYPLPKGWTQPALHAFEGACVLAAGAAIFLGWPRRRERTATVAIWLAGLEAIIATAGPYARDVFSDWRTVGAAVYAFGFSLLAALQFAWRRSSDVAR